jgi:transposase
MNKARLIITALNTENLTQQEVAKRYGVSQSWVSKLVTRFINEGEAAFEPRSRRPHTSPNKLDDHTTELILTLRKELSDQGHDSGAHTIAWHLHTHHNTTVHPATIWRCLKHHGAITPPTTKTPSLLLHPLRSRITQRNLAIRLHPLPPHKPHTCRDHHLARRPLTIRPPRQCPPPHHRQNSSPDIPGNNSKIRTTSLNTDR